MYLIYGLQKSGLSIVKFCINNKLKFKIWDDNLLVRNDLKKKYNNDYFFNSNKIERIAEKPVYNQSLGMTNLFFNSSYITDHKFNKCFYYEKNING